MPRKQHVVHLSGAERAELRRLIGSGRAPARQLARARILLKADAGTAGPRLSDRQIADAVEVSARTVARVRAAFASGGVAAALARRPRSDAPRRALDAAGETRLVALACSAPPEGVARWSLRLLADRAVELEIAPHLCAETVRTTLKKTCSSPG